MADVSQVSGPQGNRLATHAAPLPPRPPLSTPAAKAAGSPAVQLSPTALDHLARQAGAGAGADAGKTGRSDAGGRLGEALRAGMASAEALGTAMADATARLSADFEKLLRAFGVGGDEASQQASAVFDKLAADGPSFAPPPPRTDQGNGDAGQRLEMSLEVRNVELTIESGDNRVTVQFQSASLSVTASSGSLLQGLRGQGAGPVVDGRGNPADPASRDGGLYVDAGGPREDGFAGVSPTLESLLGTGGPAPESDDGGFNGTMLLRTADDLATKSDGEAVHFVLDMAVSMLKPPESGAASGSGGPKPTDQLDVRI